MGIKMVFYMYAAWKFAEREGRKPPHQYIQTWLEAIDLCVCNLTEILDPFRKARNNEGTSWVLPGLLMNAMDFLA